MLNCRYGLEIPHLLRMVHCSDVIDVLQDVIHLALSDPKIANAFTIVAIVITLENRGGAHRRDCDSGKK